MTCLFIPIGYLLMLFLNFQLLGEYIPPDKVHPKLFRHWTRPFMSTVELHKKKQNRTKSVDTEFKLMKRRIKSVKKVEGALKELGIDFQCEIVNRPNNIDQLRSENALNE